MILCKKIPFQECETGNVFNMVLDFATPTGQDMKQQCFATSGQCSANNTVYRDSSLRLYRILCTEGTGHQPGKSDNITLGMWGAARAFWWMEENIPTGDRRYQCPTEMLDVLHFSHVELNTSNT